MVIPGHSGRTKRGLININPAYIIVQMINAWFFAALCLIFLTFCAIVRVIPGPTREDQLIAVNAAITIAAAAAIALSVFWQNLFVLDTSIAIVSLCYAGTIAYAHYGKGETT
jgi:multisubunit Na+/H+ antiporter MnhF subunit